MKKILIALSSIILLAAIVLFASASFESKAKTSFHITLSSSVFLGIDGLNSTIIGYKSGADISDYLPASTCDIQSKFLGFSNDIYFYYIGYKEHCDNNIVVLQKDGVNIYSSMYKLKFFDVFEIYNKFTDYSSENLEEVLVDLNQKQRTLKAYKNLKSIDATNFLAIQKKRKYDEVSYVHGVISSILEAREYPYLIPLRGYRLPNQKSHMPNFSRAYRKDYTDGIHHGWDIFAPNETPIQAIDSGLVVKVVSDFQFSDLDKIKRGENIGELDRLYNLDLLRGNQVWLKTMKGEIVFYSHLTDVYENVKEGSFITKGTEIGTTGISGIPAKPYTDYHLHFAIQKNPYNSYKAGKYTMEDYMKWDWLLKGLSMDEVKIKQEDIFVK